MPAANSRCRIGAIGRTWWPVPATGETVESPGDGANGVAIWVHPEDTSLSLILGADDNEGLGLVRH